MTDAVLDWFLLLSSVSLCLSADVAQTSYRPRSQLCDGTWMHATPTAGTRLSNSTLQRWQTVTAVSRWLTSTSFESRWCTLWVQGDWRIGVPIVAR